MKEVVALTLPSLFFTPIFYISNRLLHLGNDPAYPDFYGFYPFPIQICNPVCGTFLFGVTGSLLYWVLGYFLYYKSMEKYNYALGNALRYSIVFGGLAILLLMISVAYILLFVPKTPLTSL